MSKDTGKTLAENTKTPEVELAEALERLKLKLSTPETKKESIKGVASRLGQIGQHAAENKNNEKDKKKTSNTKQNLGQLARATNENQKKQEKVGRITEKPAEKNDDKNKDKNEKNKTPAEKQEAKMKEEFSKIKLPSGMEIHQEGPQWVLISQDGKQRTDVTDVMNCIDKYNRSVDTANAQNKISNGAKNVAGQVTEGTTVKDGIPSTDNKDRKIQDVSRCLPILKDVNGHAVFKPEDVKAVAEVGIKYSNEKTLLNKLKDPKYLEELRNREKKNKDQAMLMASKTKQDSM
jgi:hypothetical protein